MLNIGCHLSVSQGFENMGKQILSLGGNTFQFFTRNPRGGKAKDIDKDDVDRLIILMKNNNFAPILAHAPYTLNPCSANERTREFAFETMADDLKRMELLPGNMYNFHPGSHVGQGIEKAVPMIAEVLNTVMWDEMSTTVLLETMSGKGSEVGSRFEELRTIIDLCDYKDKLGVCLDTCHVFDGGYDIKDKLDSVLDKFDKVIGLNGCRLCTLTTARILSQATRTVTKKSARVTSRTRAFERIVTHPALKALPCYLETPNELDGYKREIELLKSF